MPSILSFAMSLNNHLLLLSFSITLSAGMYMPDSDLPFEFNHKKGSVVNAENVIVQSVSSDGKSVIKTNNPAQLSKKYDSQSNDEMNTIYYKNPKKKDTDKYVQNPHKTQSITHDPFPAKWLEYTTNIQPNDLIDTIKKYFPEMKNMKIMYL